MFIAHLPAGYLLTSPIAKGRRNLLIAGLVGSVLPDTDLLWFYLVNDRQHAHHEFFFHWPLFWIGLALVLWALNAVFRLGAGRIIGVALAALMLHMALDSVAAEVSWLAPFSDMQVNLVRVPAVYDWWVWNFVLHWTFLIELAIVGLAAFRVWKGKGA